ncbi:hypothetical protein F2Q70_00013749 [Brassica cretica]|uniref:Uncharacterized protein n=1 Tax=Brassica cretica TaxID=69181 RepID=A0A8S9LXQ8_BRACR|nr:hypothetical protein F2Q70_00013749 [Brassica cretica]
MDTRGKEKDLDKDSNPVVQSTNISGVTTDSSAKTIGQSEPVYNAVAVHNRRVRRAHGLNRPQVIRLDWGGYVLFLTVATLPSTVTMVHDLCRLRRGPLAIGRTHTRIRQSIRTVRSNSGNI